MELQAVQMFHLGKQAGPGRIKWVSCVELGRYLERRELKELTLSKSQLDVGGSVGAEQREPQSWERGKGEHG